MSSRVIVEPPVEPLTLAEVKLDRAITHDQHDDLLRGLIRAARAHVERYCGLSLVTQTREATFTHFPDYLQLDFGPVQEVLSVDYVASDGTSTALADYLTDLRLGRIAPTYDGYWPTVRTQYNGVTVRYVAGFEPAEGSPTDYTANIPPDLRTAMFLLVGHWYENREATFTGTFRATNAPLEYGVKSLLDLHRMRTGLA